MIRIRNPRNMYLLYLNWFLSQLGVGGEPDRAQLVRTICRHSHQQYLDPRYFTERKKKKNSWDAKQFQKPYEYKYMYSYSRSRTYVSIRDIVHVFVFAKLFLCSYSRNLSMLVFAKPFLSSFSRNCSYARFHENSKLTLMSQLKFSPHFSSKKKGPLLYLQIYSDIFYFILNYSQFIRGHTRIWQIL